MTYTNESNFIVTTRNRLQVTQDHSRKQPEENQNDLSGIITPLHKYYYFYNMTCIIEQRAIILIGDSQEKFKLPSLRIAYFSRKLFLFISLDLRWAVQVQHILKTLTSDFSSNSKEHGSHLLIFRIKKQNKSNKENFLWGGENFGGKEILGRKKNVFWGGIFLDSSELNLQSKPPFWNLEREADSEIPSQWDPLNLEQKFLKPEVRRKLSMIILRSCWRLNVD